jgi:hypothetical protein
VDIAITGAPDPTIVVDGTSFAAVAANDVHDNPGAALTIRPASARLAHSAPPRIRRGR